LGTRNRLERTPEEFSAAVTTIYQAILATMPDERAAAMASEIQKEHPDLVALHEASMLRTGLPKPPTVKMDLIQSLLGELENYALVADPTSGISGTRTNLDAEAPSTLGFSVRITDQDAIIARTDIDMQTTAVEVHDFSTVQTILTPVGPIIIPGGWVSLDATIRGQPLRFVSVHLDPGPSIDTMLAQAKELVEKTAGATALPIVFGGDFNAPAVNDPSKNPYYVVYQALIAGGLTDAWNKDDPGFTFGQDGNLRNSDSQLSVRIDLVLYRGDFHVENIELVGDKQADKTPSGLWPSDHAGVVATLQGLHPQVG
jgi:endonuclease/exonuclease/phosphatase (EEP) superfamily protein YafD